MNRTGWVAVAGFVFLLAALPVEAGELVVFVAERSNIADLSPDTLADIYLGNIEYMGEQRLAPVFYVEGNDARAAFLRAVLDVTNDGYKGYWIRRVFRDGGMPPKEVITEQEAIEQVRGRPGAIGFLRTLAHLPIPGLRPVLRVHFD